MTIAETRREGMVQLDVEGRVDTNTSPELQKRILEAVDYISSSGLRALLIGQKTASSKGGSMKLMHVRDSVRKVFDMTGFSQMLTIE